MTRDEIILEIAHYLRLCPGWDGRDGRVPRAEEVGRAIRLMMSLPDDLPMPHPRVGPDGEVGVYWRTKRLLVEVEFTPDGDWFHADLDGAQTYPYDGEVRALPGDVLEMIRRGHEEGDQAL